MVPRLIYRLGPPKRSAQALEQSCFLPGVLVLHRPAHRRMPLELRDVSVLLLRCPLAALIVCRWGGLCGVWSRAPT